MKRSIAAITLVLIAGAPALAQTAIEQGLALKQRAETLVDGTVAITAVARDLNDWSKLHEMCSRQNALEAFMDDPVAPGAMNRAGCCDPVLRVHRANACVGTFISTLPSLDGVGATRKARLLWDEAKGIVEGGLHDQFQELCTSDAGWVRSCVAMDERSRSSR